MGDLDSQFLNRITSTENDLLTINRSSLDDFTHQWTTLASELEAAIIADRLSPSTIKAAHTLSNRVSQVVQTFLDLELLAEKLMASLLDDTSSTFNIDTPSPEIPEPAVPSYLRAAHKWLVDHIHNPYPPTHVRDAISRESGAARKDIDNWFIDARKRIGWNATRKAYFSNKRVEIVDAATRFYANDEKLSLSQGAEHALISVMRNARDLYCDKFDQTMLASKLAAAVKDLTPETKAEAKVERIRQAQLKKDRNPYPSPEHSPEPAYPSPMLSDDVVDSGVKPISINSRKRQNVEPAELGQDEGSRKRRRLDAPSSSHKSVTFPAGLPSPASSVDESFQATEPAQPVSPSSFAPSVTSRKRRLSESDIQSVPKRPCHLPAGPRLQAVSDPLPLYNNLSFDEASFDGWFQQVFDRSGIGELSPSGFSVELGNLTDYHCETPAMPELSEQTFEPPTIEVADIPAVLDVPWNELNAGWTNNLTLSSDVMGQLSSQVNFPGQDSPPEPLAQNFVNFQLSPQVSRSEFESYFGINSSLVDPVVISLNSAMNEAWDLPDDLNRDHGTIFGKHNAGFAGSNDLFSSLDFSQTADFLPSSDANSFPILAQDKIRQEKEKEFREACEKAQRLALELQKDDLFVW